MGLDKTVIPAGYRKDDYLDVLACFDRKVFLVPGSDGPCRAVRELMVMGKPAIAAKRGMLPADENLAAAILKLVRDMDMRESMVAEARKKAISSFSLVLQGKRMERVHNQVMRGYGDSL